MLHFEYLNLKLTASKGCINVGTPEEMIWNHARIVITKNGVSTVKTLAGGLEKIEDHLNNQLAFYRQQGWQPIKVEKTEYNKETSYFKNTIQCVLKRSIQLEHCNRFDELITDSIRTYQWN